MDSFVAKSMDSGALFLNSFLIKKINRMFLRTYEYVMNILVYYFPTITIDRQGKRNQPAGAAKLKKKITQIPLILYLTPISIDIMRFVMEFIS